MYARYVRLLCLCIVEFPCARVSCEIQNPENPGKLLWNVPCILHNMHGSIYNQERECQNIFSGTGIYIVEVMCRISTREGVSYALCISSIVLMNWVGNIMS